jgi:regulator of replication initiation timing
LKVENTRLKILNEQLIKKLKRKNGDVSMVEESPAKTQTKKSKYTEDKIKG